MEIKLIAIILLVAIVFFAILYGVKNSKQPIKRAVSSVFSGLIALAAVNIAGIFTGVYIPVSTLSICVSAVGGIPAVSAMLIIDTFIK